MTNLALWQLLQEIAPTDCTWREDNIGFLVGRRDAAVQTVLFSLDMSLDVIQEAADRGATVIVTHHPVIFHAARTITDETATGRRVLSLIEKGIASICLHTNYDGAADGLNDLLARTVGLTDCNVLVNADGAYGRYGTVTGAQTLPSYVDYVQEVLGAKAIRFWDAGRPVSKVCVGSGGSGGLFERVIAAGCDTFITGDVRHDLFCDARDMGLNLIDAGHFATENIMCDHLIKQVAARAPELTLLKAHQSLMPYDSK